MLAASQGCFIIRMPSKEGAQKRGTKRKLAAEQRASPAQEAGVETDVSTVRCMLPVLLYCLCKTVAVAFGT